MIKPVQTAILTTASVAAAAAYASVGSASPQGETVPIRRLAADPEEWRGREVRTCGPSFRGDRAKGEWQLSLPRASGYHPAIVRILGCAGVKPARDSNGCVSGRIARRDGSIRPTREGEERTISSAIVSYDWYLHAQCPAPRRD